jgi:hypothetical protein
VELQQRFAQGAAFALEGRFAGEYRSVDADRVMNGDGSPRETREARWRIAGDGVCAPRRALLFASVDGRDVTERRRRELAGAAEAKTPPAASDPAAARREVSVSLRLPFGDGAKDYRFGAVVSAGELCRQPFEPPPDVAKPRGYLRGQMIWRCATLEPVRLTAELLGRPWYLRRAVGRVEYLKVGARWVAGLVAFTGEMKILFYHRKAERETRYEEFVVKAGE